MESKRLPVFAERFHELREKMGMSQAAFADYLGISRPTVGFYENGSRLPDALVLVQICERCNVPSDYLLGILDEPITDVETRTICGKLGLSQAVVNWLQALPSYKPLETLCPYQNFKLGINAFLEHPSSHLFLSKLASTNIDTEKIISLIESIDNNASERGWTQQEKMRYLLEDDFFNKERKENKYSRLDLKELAVEIVDDLTGKRRLSDQLMKYGSQGGGADGDS